MKKVRPLGNLTDIYYTYSDWDTKIIDGVEFVSVVKSNPEKYPMNTQTLYRMRKDNLEVIK
jgi:hypothetical protein